MNLVVDASVAVKWVLRDHPHELDTDRGLSRCSVQSHGKQIRAVQPAHWVAEVVGVITRLKPDRAPATIALLMHSRFGTVASRAVYRRASGLSMMLNHHLFDTLYHAVALEEGLRW